MKTMALFVSGLFFLANRSLMAFGDCLKVYREESGPDAIALFADSTALYPCQLELRFKLLKNLNVDRPLPLYKVLKEGQKKVPLLTLRIQRAGQASYEVAVHQAMGDPALEIEDVPYWLPFAHGTKCKLVQGYGGKVSHGPPSEYSLDFQMETGTAVHAARPGLVVAVKSDSNAGGPSPGFNDLANRIVIYHEDGTFARYAHLKYRGVVVKTGQQVAAGQLIGYSGNTGYSHGPHLHFEVSRAGILQQESIPTRFITGAGVQPLQEGEYYYASHPGGPAFVEKYGKDLKPEDFKYHQRSVEATDQVTLRYEKHDDTIAFFIQNGYARARKITLELKLENLSASHELPISVTVPAHQELFLLLARPLNPRARMQWSASYSIQ